MCSAAQHCTMPQTHRKCKQIEHQQADVSLRTVTVDQARAILEVTLQEAQEPSSHTSIFSANSPVPTLDA